MAHAALYAYTAFYIGRVHELFSFLAPLRIVLVLGLVSVVLAFATPPALKNTVWRQQEVWLVTGLAALALLFSPFGVWTGQSWSFLTETYSRVLVFFFLVVALATSARVIQNLVWSILVGIGLLGVFTIQGAGVVDFAGGRFYASSTYDPNDVAMMMVCSLPLAAFGAVAVRGIARMFFVGAALICVVAVVMTVSRGGFIGLVFVLLLLLFRLGTAGLAPRLAILMVVVAAVALATPPQYWDVMRTIWNPTGEGYVESGVFVRTELWKGGVNLFLENPIMGVGIGTYHVAEGLSHGGRGKWSTAHNSFIQLATELGIIGFALFVALLVISIRNARGALRAARSEAGLYHLGWIAAAVEMSLYAYMVVGFALSQAYSPMLYFLIGVATALRLQVEEHRRAASATVEAPAPKPRMVPS